MDRLGGTKFALISCAVSDLCSFLRRSYVDLLSVVSLMLWPAAARTAPVIAVAFLEETLYRSNMLRSLEFEIMSEHVAEAFSLSDLWNLEGTNS